MPKQIIQYNIFVASPSDVKVERDSLEEIIKEINLSTANNFGIKLELIRWESHVYPDFGLSSQEVINKQINDDYDIFIGIMWSKFGTPTKIAESGTKEEFLRAYEKWKMDEKSMKLMFYFKNSPIQMENIDFEQIQFIRDFKNELGEKGGLYWHYKDTEEFNQLLRIHINKVIGDLIKENESKLLLPVINSEKNNQVQLVNVELENIDDIGLFENIEISLAKFEESTISLGNITGYLNDLSGKLNNRTSSINKLVNVSNEMKMREGKRITDLLSTDIMNFVNRTKVEIPIFKNLYQTAFNAFSNAYSISKTLGLDKKEVEIIKNTILDLKNGLMSGIHGMSSFKSSMEEFPNISTSINKAKKQAIKTLDDLISEFEFAIQLSDEFESLY